MMKVRQYPKSLAIAHRNRFQKLLIESLLFSHGLLPDQMQMHMI